MPKVTFAATGQTFEVADGTSFLELCNSQGAEYDFGCTVGSCGTCRMEILEGAQHVQPPSEDEKETIEMATDVEGARLGCQLVIGGDVTIRQLTD